MQFKDILGHTSIKNALIKGVNQGQIPHAQLFVGPTGCGHLPIALAYAQYINCTSKSKEDSCGECSNCHKNTKVIHPDIHFAFPVVNNIKGVDHPLSMHRMKDWRTFLSENAFQDLTDWLKFIQSDNRQGNISKEESRQILQKMYMQPFEADYKIQFIWMPEMMNESAANSLLKLFEEPPPKTVFLMISNSTEKLLTTILSRTQIVKFQKYSDAEIKQMLAKHYELEDSRVRQISFLAEGDFNRALKLCHSEVGEEFDFFRNWFRNAYKRDMTGIQSSGTQFQKLSREGQKKMLLYSLTMVRECYLCTLGIEGTVRLEGEELLFAQNFSKFTNINNMPDYYDMFNNSVYHLERNASPKILFADLSLKLMKIFN